MKITYYGESDIVGHGDWAYFEVEKDSKETVTGKEYVVYWLTDTKGNRAPESVYRELLGID